MKRLLDLRHRQFVKDAVVLQLATLVQVGTYFATSVLTARYLGETHFGRWNTAREIYQMAWFLVSMGVVNATVSRYSESVGRQDRRGCVDALAASIKIGSVTSVAVLLLGFVLGPWIAREYYSDEQVGWYGAILCIAGLFEVVRGLTVAALQGTRQMREFAWFDITTNSLRVVIVWAALESGWGIPGVIAAFLVHMLVAGLMALRWYARARDGHAKLAPPPLREVLAAVPRAPVRQLFGLSYLLALNKSMNTLVPRLGLLLIPALAAITPDDAFRKNGHYAAANNLAWGLGLAMTGVVQTLLPALGLKLGQTDVPFERLGGLMRRISLLAGGLMVVATLISVPVMYLVIRVFYGEAYLDSFDLYLWLTSGNLFIGFAVIIEPFYIFSGRLKAAIPFNFVMAGLHAAGIVVGGQLWGPIGVAAAAGLGRAFAGFHLVYIWVYFRRAARRRGGPLHPGQAP